MTFSWFSLYWFALETCSSIPHRTASQPVHLRAAEGRRRPVRKQETDDHVRGDEDGPIYEPLLQGVDYVRELVGAEIATYAAVHLHLLVPLVQFALDDVAVNGLNQQVFQLAHILQLELLKEQRVRQALWGEETKDGAV